MGNQVQSSRSDKSLKNGTVLICSDLSPLVFSKFEISTLVYEVTVKFWIDANFE